MEPTGDLTRGGERNKATCVPEFRFQLFNSMRFVSSGGRLPLGCTVRPSVGVQQQHVELQGQSKHATSRRSIETALPVQDKHDCFPSSHPTATQRASNRRAALGTEDWKLQL